MAAFFQKACKAWVPCSSGEERGAFFVPVSKGIGLMGVKGSCRELLDFEGEGLGLELLGQAYGNLITLDAGLQFLACSYQTYALSWHIACP